ncbi:type VI secretion system lipoprotein TssJ [Caldimonas taiwanensis]|uniref:type VI secretion system lipoprotein TssJ n=1 Tax=Caldimonas taiwanensis TaxID=307483 RepID=UPI00078556C8|nr:type VI secretion system lipoprotein TssJ [Caldimonas taiwanensis]
MWHRAPPALALLARVLSVVALAGVVGCASAGKAVDAASALTSGALRLIGLAPQESPPPNAQPARIAVRMQASESLNVDDHGRSLSLVMRVYKLKGIQAFESAPQDAFTSPARERELLGDELIEVREIQMLPGQHREWHEVLPAEATHLGIVALFHHPAAQSWRLTFDAKDAAKTGLSLGLHACSLSVAIGRSTTSSANPVPSAPAGCQRG